MDSGIYQSLYWSAPLLTGPRHEPAFSCSQGKLLQGEDGPIPQPFPPSRKSALGAWHQGQGQTNHGALSFTNLMKAQWDIYVWEDATNLACKALPEGGHFLAACSFWGSSPRPERCWSPNFGLWSHHFDAGWVTGTAKRRQDRFLQPRLGPGLVLRITLRCAGLCQSVGDAGSCWYEWHSGASWWSPGPGGDVSS